MNRNDLGSRIAQRRKELGMTQRELADGLGITDRAVSRWERGIGSPDISLLEPLAETLKMSIDELMTGKTVKASLSTKTTSYQIPEWMRRNQEVWEQEEKDKEERLRKIVPVMGTWMTVLLWLMLPTVLVALILVNPESKLYIPGQILTWMIGFAVALVFLRMSSVESHYRLVGWCSIGILIMGAVGGLLLALGVAENSLWFLAVILPEMVLSLCASYHEFTGHAKVLEDINDSLSEKWEKLRPVHLVFTALEQIAMLLLVVAPIFGMIVRMFASIGVSITSILNLTYTFKTARFFREYPIIFE